MNGADEKKALFEFLFYFAAVLGIMFLIIHFVGQRTVVSGSSMEPIISKGLSECRGRQ